MLVQDTDTDAANILCQQAHEVAGGVWVEAERRDDDVGGRMSPVLVVILHPTEHCMSHRGLSVDYLIWTREKTD